MKISRAILIKKPDRVLVLKRNRFDDNKFSDLPGGKVEKRETTKQALRREIYEETKLAINDQHLFYIGQFFFKRSFGLIQETIYCSDISEMVKTQKIALSSQEHSMYEFCKFDKLVEKNFHEDILKLIVENKHKIFKAIQ